MTATGPVTFSDPISFDSLGLSGYSSGQTTNSIISELEQLDQPTVALQEQDVQNLTTQQNTLSTIGTQVATLQNALTALSTQTDPSDIGSALQAVATAYNSVITTVDQQFPQATATGTIMAGAGTLNGDPVTMQLQNDLQGITTMTGGQPGNTYTSLSEIGVTVDGTGQMSVDQTALQNALDTDPNAVSDLLTDPSDGLIQQINTMLSQYTDPTSGFLLNDVQSMQAQVDSLNSSIQTQQSVATEYAGTLQTAFDAMQQAMVTDNVNYQILTNSYSSGSSLNVYA